MSRAGAERAGSDGIERLRRQAWRAFESRGLPTTRDEDWKYTDLSRLVATLGESWWTPAPETEADASAWEPLAVPGLEDARFVFVNGRLAAAPAGLPEGVCVTRLAEALQDQDEAADALGWDGNAPLASAFAPLNAALAREGLCLEVAPGTRLEAPLYLLHVSAGGGAAHTRHLVRVGRGARAHVVEHFASLNGAAPGLSHPLTRAWLAEGAELIHERLLMEDKGSFHIGRLEVEQQAGSRLQSASLALPKGLARVDIVSRLLGENARAELDGLYLADGRAHVDHHTHVAHERPNCASRERYKGMVAGRGHAVFNGKVVVHPGADGTDASQYNANLLLSRHAEVDAKPELEIYADEVQCSHGATVGQLDETQLFYLQSRGLAEDAARNVLTFAFAEDVLTGLESDAVRRHLERAVLERLPGGAALEGVI